MRVLTWRVIDFLTPWPNLPAMRTKATEPNGTAGGARFPSLLKHWRQVRRLTQLELAGEAEISARHLCFLETGRSCPSRDMVEQLGTALDLPLAERNQLHVAAGFVPPYADDDLDAQGLHPVRQALEFILSRHEPYPAIVIDGGWDIRMRNAASRRVLKVFHAAYRMPPEIVQNAMHVVFHPRGLRPFIANWEAFAGQMIQLLHREAAQCNMSARSLLDEILRYPGIPTDWRRPSRPASTSPMLTMQLAMGDLRLAFFSTFTTFAMPADASLQKLKIEGFYPADETTERHVRAIAEG